MTNSNPHIDIERARLLVKLWNEAQLDLAGSAELDKLALDYSASEAKFADAELDADLQLIAVLARSRRSADQAASVSPEIAARWDAAIAREANAESRGNRRRLSFPMRRRSSVAAAAVAAFLLLGAGIFTISRSINLGEGNLASSRPEVSRSDNSVVAESFSSESAASSASSLNAGARSANKGKLIAKNIAAIAATASSHANASIGAPGEIISDADSSEAMTEFSYANQDSDDYSDSDPVFLPASASLPDVRPDENLRLASLAIDNSGNAFDNARDEGEQSIARVALILEDIFSSFNSPE